MNTDIVYTPIDIDITLPSHDDLVNYVKNMTILSPDDPYNEGITLMVGHIAKMDSYKAHMSWKNGGLLVDKDNPNLTTEAVALYDSKFIKEIDRERKYNFYWEPEFQSRFPSIVEAISKMPFKQLFAVFFGYAGYEISPTHRDNYNFMNEITVPVERYNILLTRHSLPCFYFTKEKENTKHIFPNIKKSNPIYAFDNRVCFHGSSKPDDTTKDRIQLLVWGTIDVDAHTELINRSVAKFESDVIRISDLE